MGKGKRAHTISIPSINLTTPKSSSDHSFSVSPPSFLQKSHHLDVSSRLLHSSTSTLVQQHQQTAPKRWTPPRKPKMKYDDLEHKMDAAPLYVLVLTYLNYFVLILFGHLRDILGKVAKPQAYAHLKTSNGYAPLVSDFDSFYTRRLYMRIRLTGEKSNKLNLASYNYLGFSDNKGPCADAVEKAANQYGLASTSVRAEAGSTHLLGEVERMVARFVGKEDAMCVSMGFATNSTTIPAIVDKGCLVISDELNHASIVFGVRLSGASVRVFKHNNMDDLRELLREVISQGQPRTHRPWKKILVIVEGLYSMEGTMVNLPGLVELKKEFGFYLYVDEAHSIGALGENGGGICDFFGVDPANVDIMMGTFTKSFGAAGGYIAADKSVIDHLRLKNHAYVYAEPMSVPVAQQVMTTMRIICGEDGSDDGRKRIKQLAENALYFSSRLRQMGFIVYGDHGSPVIPLLLFNPAKMPAFSRGLLERGIAVCLGGYPATPIISSRARFCVSAAHTREDLDFALKQISEVGDLLMLKLVEPPSEAEFAG
ncbi:pyridoxal phosphate-dependent transferase [Zychaea mexicana]|uniref:pyridoxal phosphate-dependent transferase n=1 Tax=Zychaea mexicana TaxID=64656 RepID=UPI0022FDD8C9|nr:pyridoxal phosphate-dependent transferase [Zychaea mexicana]KAI9494488.1 pyridoxal phosphate-dependent transferase [Zychaea mexicana]